MRTRLFAFLDGRPLDEKPVQWQWHDLWRLAGLYIVIQLVMTIFVYQILRRALFLPSNDAHIIIYAVSVFILIAFVRHYEFWPNASYLGTRLVDFKRYWKVGVIYGVAVRLLPALPVVVVAVILYFMGRMPYLPTNNPVTGQTLFSLSWFLGALRANIFAPIFEEYFFRGLLYPLLRLRYGVTWGIIWSSLLFGVLHGSNLLGFWAVFGGIGLALAYEHTGKLATPIIAHFFGNAVATVLASF